ncbi:unnamed protein product [Ilex paraguariensis]|uniref:Uncharacterized protein n=1 Tax=Ilex paraguariensis TaxID=185542 RepID=A0ABC8TQW8_9AQUA
MVTILQYCKCKFQVKPRATIASELEHDCPYSQLCQNALLMLLIDNRGLKPFQTMSASQDLHNKTYIYHVPTCRSNLGSQ